MDTVTASFRPDINNRVTNTSGRRIENIVRIGQAHGHRIDKDIAVIGRMEVGFAANGRHTHAVAVPADAFDNTT